MAVVVAKAMAEVDGGDKGDSIVDDISIGRGARAIVAAMAAVRAARLQQRQPQRRRARRWARRTIWTRCSGSLKS